MIHQRAFQAAALLSLLLSPGCGPWAGPGTLGATRQPEPRYQRVDAEGLLRTASRSLLACHANVRAEPPFAQFAARMPPLAQDASAAQLSARTPLPADQRALFLQFTRRLSECQRRPLDSVLRPVLHRTAYVLNLALNDYQDRLERMVYRNLSWGELNAAEAPFLGPMRTALSVLDDTDRRRNEEAR